MYTSYIIGKPLFGKPLHASRTGGVKWQDRLSKGAVDCTRYGVCTWARVCIRCKV